MLLAVSAQMTTLDPMPRPAPNTTVRLSLWIRPEHFDIFTIEFARHMAPLLKKHGLINPTPCQRLQADGIFSRTFTTSSLEQTYALQRALKNDHEWQQLLVDLATKYAPEPASKLSYRLSTYTTLAEPTQVVKAGSGYHQGLWHSFNVQDGLPSSQITRIIQDQKGDLWLRTRAEGICRYDGRQFSTFALPENLQSESSNSALLEDAAGKLWFSSEEGLYRSDGTRIEIFTTEDGLAENCAVSILEDGRGHIWFQHRDHAVSHYNGERFTCVDLGIGKIQHMIQDQQGHIWFSGARGLCRFDGEHFSTMSGTRDLPVIAVYNVLGDQDGQLWCATSAGLYRFADGHFSLLIPLPTNDSVRLLICDAQGGIWFTSQGGLYRSLCGQIEPFDLPSEGISSALQDGDGHLWFTTRSNGLLLFDGESLIHYTTRDGLGHNCVMDMLEDREGRLWFASWGGGLSRYDGKYFKHFTRTDGLAHDEVESICQDRQGDLWFATRGRGISRYDGKEFTNFSAREGLPHDSVWSIYQDRSGQLQFGVSGHQLVHFDGQRFVCTDLGIDCSAIWSFCETRDGRLWLGTNQGGAVCLDGSAIVRHITTADGLPHDIIWDLHEDRNGILWLATWAGICRYDGDNMQTFTRADGLAHDNVWCLHEDRNGHMWFGTWGGGVCHYDGQVFTNYTRDDGLADNNVRCIHEDEDGILWFGTYGGGVCRYDGQVFCSLSRKNGLIHDAVQHIICDEQKNYWIATEGGVTRYTPPRVPPAIHIDGVVADRRYDKNEDIVISSAQRLITFEFHGASFTTDPDQFAYVYRLLGWRDSWQTSYRPRVEYANLPNGQYTFEVKAVDRDLNYSPTDSVALNMVPNLQQDRINALQAELSQNHAHGLDQFIGQSDILQQALDQIYTVSTTDVTALVLGDTGTGKGLAARAIHTISSRRDRPFIQVNCGAIPEGLIESELFGHEKGAFTGAVQRQIGRFELADEGTIFLDEIGDLPLESQRVLLQVLQDGTLQRVGGQKQIQVDVRVVAATNRDLRQAMLQGTFREDLYFRLSAFTLHLPSLRQRRDDVPLLMHHFVEQFARHLHRPTPHIDPSVLSYLQEYNWPGNVRELEHMAQRAILVCKDDCIHLQDIPLLDAPPPQPEPAVSSTSANLSLDEHEKQLIAQALRTTNGIVYGERGAAQLLDVHPEKLRAKIRKYDLKKTGR